MALRPVFVPKFTENTLVDTVMTEFLWVPGLSRQQKMKNVENLHSEFSKNKLVDRSKILEVSSKSDKTLGNNLSAFNLYFFNELLNKKISVECAYQGSKKFERGGPFLDIYDKSSLEAKKDVRLKSSGNIISFNYGDDFWDIHPENAFYNYIYIKALIDNEDKYHDVINYTAFTDIEFNPGKSINCQAYAVALYVSLKSRGHLKDAMKDKYSFLDCIQNFNLINSRKNTLKQPTLF